ncbi:hypothetical protein F4775DRAFT_549412 [Biscogniauxia sp. FL1348]|nr:hypothetical protein F4775DRAFT_549412 [Biscogniauxia sp. FL1348]
MLSEQTSLPTQWEKSDSTTLSKCQPTIGPCSVRSGTGTRGRLNYWHDNGNSTRSGIGRPDAPPEIRECTTQYSQGSSLGMGGGTCDLSRNEDDFTFPIISLQSQLAMDSSNHPLIAARNKITELTIREFLCGSWVGNNNRGRAQSWPLSLNAREHALLTDRDTQVDGRQEHGRIGIYTTDAERSRAISRTLACPFYRHDPTKHLSCLQYGNMPNIEGLVQHLEDAHCQQPYCPTCNALFSTSESCDDHIRRRGCSPQAATWSMGVTHREMQDIIDEANVPKVTTVRWFNIWSVIFPEEEPPLQPYLSGRLELTICVVRDFWMKSGPQIVSNFLRENDMHTSMSLNDEPTALTLYHAVLDQIIDQLILSSKEPKDHQAQGCGRAAQILASLPPLTQEGC